MILKIILIVLMGLAVFMAFVAIYSQLYHSLRRAWRTPPPWTGEVGDPYLEIFEEHLKGENDG
jgi:hypothetical protein